MSKDKTETALVTARTFVNGVLHMPGELATVDLAALGVDKIGKKTPGLEPHTGKAGEPIEAMEIAAIAPHAPNPAMPQGLPPGSVISGTGRTLTPADAEQDELAREPVAPEPEPKQAKK